MESNYEQRRDRVGANECGGFDKNGCEDEGGGLKKNSGWVPLEERAVANKIQESQLI